jgi:alpha-beta hydrolase superfamily lysophospholipase
MSLLILAAGAASLGLFFLSGDRWIPPSWWGRSPFGTDTRVDGTAAFSTATASTPSGVTLSMRVMEPANEPHMIAFVIHGLCLHGAWCAGLGEALAAHGVLTVLLDLHGHGRSEGKRGFLPDRATLIADIAHVVSHARCGHPKLPLLLVGHSVAAEFVLSRELSELLAADGADIVGGCGLAPYFAGGATQARFDIRRPVMSLNPRGLLSSRWPALRYKLPRAWSDADLQTTFDRSLLSLLRSREMPAGRLRALGFPVLLLVGEDDAIISPRSVEALQSGHVVARRIAGADHMSVMRCAADLIVETFVSATSRRKQHDVESHV